MVNDIKVKCINSTYVEKFHPITNFLNNEILTAGILNVQHAGINSFKSVINFKITDISPASIESAYLYVYVEELKYTGNSPNNIGICGNYETLNYSTLNWNNFPKNGFTQVLYLSLPKNSNGSYIKMNITSLIKDLSDYDINYNLVFGALNADSNILLRIGSCMSQNPPYIKFKLNSHNNVQVPLTDIPGGFMPETDNISKNAEDEIFNQKPSDENKSDKNNFDLNKIIENPAANLSSDSDKKSYNSSRSHDSKTIEYLKNSVASKYDIDKISSKINNSDSTINSISKSIDQLTPMLSSILDTVALNSAVQGNNPGALKELEEHLEQQNTSIDSLKAELLAELKNTSDAVAGLKYEMPDESVFADLKSIMKDINASINSQTVIMNKVNDALSNLSSSEDVNGLKNTITDFKDNLASDPDSAKNKEFMEKVNTSFEKIDKRLNSFDVRLIEVTQTLDNFVEEMESMSTLVPVLSKNLESVKKNTEDLNNSSISDLSKKLDNLNKNISNVIDAVSGFSIDTFDN